MSIRAIPLLIFVFVFYNLIVLFGGNADPNIALRKEVFGFTLPNGKFPWSFSRGDLVILLLLVMLFFELLKATYTSTTSLLDHGLSMLVFVVCLIEFLMISHAQTSIFFFLVVATLIDVIAGYTIGIRVARRDLAIGG
ncbi:MAG: hypothetical protein KDJ36_03825 [Hyphomicrobiaceae bacterium]|nr:hypothetical protein [Hyphomicrobiaceae bacterium]